VQRLIVEFCKGYVKNDAGDETAVYIAITQFDTIVIAEDSREIVSEMDAEHSVVTESITRIVLPGVDREGVEVIVGNILEGGYLTRPGSRLAGDALLFTLVNEAIHVLEETAADFSLTE